MLRFTHPLSNRFLCIYPSAKAKKKRICNKVRTGETIRFPFEDEEEEEELYYIRISRENGLSVPATSLRHTVSSCRYCGFIMDCSTEQWEGKERHLELSGHDTFQLRQEHHCEFKGSLTYTLRVFLKIQNQRKQKQILKTGRKEVRKQVGKTSTQDWICGCA